MLADLRQFGNEYFLTRMIIFECEMKGKMRHVFSEKQHPELI